MMKAAISSANLVELIMEKCNKKRHKYIINAKNKHIIKCINKMCKAYDNYDKILFTDLCDNVLL